MYLRGYYQAFTFIEVLITLLIIGIVTSLAGVYYNKAIQDTKLNQTADIIYSDLITYQRLADAEVKKYTFDFTNKNYYFVTKEDYPEKVHKRELPSGIKIIKTTFRKKIPGKDKVILHPSGAPSCGGTITIQNRNGNKKYIIISPFWGRVRIDTKPP